MNVLSCLRRVVFGWVLAWSSVCLVYAAPQGERMINLSSRAQVGTGADQLTGGFVIAGSGAKRVLITGIGPRLTQVGVSGALVDPVLTLYNVQGTAIATNDDWQASDAATIASVGAGPFALGSRDAALVVTLNPGVYTAIVSGKNNAIGEGMVEVYDLSDTPRFVNLSARAVVGANALIAGIVVGPSQGARRLLVRAAGPVLTTVGVPGALSDPRITVYNSSGAPIASNDDWGSNNLTSLATYTQQAGATPFPSGSKDSAVVVEVPAGGFTIHVTGVGGAGGVAVLEAFDISPDNQTGPTVSVAATSGATSLGAAPAVFTLTRLGNTNAALTVSYSTGGTAVAGTDYTALTGNVTFAAGASTATVTVTPIASQASVGAKTVTLTLASGQGYGLGIATTASATIFYDAGSLFVSGLRPTSGAIASTASGSSTLQLSPDERFLTINLGVSNLSSAQTVAYLRLAPPGGQEFDLLLLPKGQVTGIVWEIAPNGTYTVAGIVAALKAGQLFVSVETVNYPTGELRGSFVRSTGSQIFTAPAAPPALPATLPTAAEASRFLMQATFGPNQAEIDALMQKGFSTWIAEQMVKPHTLLRSALMADFAIDGHDPVTVLRPSRNNRQAAWWKIAVTSEDQLRQRVAFALSEIFVISDANGTLDTWQEGMANYYDILGRGAFGNFRTLLGEVTLNPMMGIYLTSLRNTKATATTFPDENYAREVMQLFTIGLNELQPDGTLKLGSSGLPTPTYTQTTISETAKVFTGLDYNSTRTPLPNFRGAAADYINPMMFYASTNPTLGHETGAKTIVTGKVLPANQTGMKDLNDTLDTLFNHPNTGPFICRQLIQRLVASNPSPGYVYRVAQVFADNGSGVRGDMAAVVRAILTDYEARSPAILGNPGYGKLKEPLLRSTGLLRAFNAYPGATTGTNVNRYVYNNPESLLAQASLRAPTVFNFFEPNYVVPGTLAAAGLYGPEYQILTDTTTISIPQQLYNFAFASSTAAIAVNYAAQLPLAKQPGPLVDQLNLLLCAGSLQTAHKSRIVAALNGMATNTTDLVRVQNAVYLVATSPAGAVQK